MKTTLRLLPLLLLALALSGLAKAQEAVPFPVSKTAQAAARANNAFAFKLYEKLAEEPGNTFFSPYSIESALGMTLAGAQGDTYAEMARVLVVPPTDFHAGLGELTRHLIGAPVPHLPDSPSVEPQRGIAQSLPASHSSQGEGSPGNVEPEAKPATGPDSLLIPPADSDTQPPVPNHLIQIANRLWPQTGFEFKQSFLDTVTSNYGAGIQELDFRADPDAAKDTINRWVEEQTQDKDGEPMIKDLIKELSSSTRLVLTNAIYFKGDWASKFDKDDTQEDGTFSRLDGSVIDDVPLMNQTQRLGYAQISGVGQILELPYQADALSFIAILPERGQAGFAALESRLSLEAFEGWMERVYRQKVRVTLPRFELEKEFQLADTLSAMGMPSAFDPGAADFRGMTARQLPDGSEQNLLNIDQVIHKAVAKVNEEGSEMAAATAVIVVKSTALPLPPPEFRADRPFVFLVRENRTGTILFMGRVMEPK